MTLPAEPVSAPPDEASGGSGSENIAPSAPTLVWAWKNAEVLLWCWLIPISRSPIERYDPHQRSGARAFAVAGIVILTFLIRSFSDEGAQIRFDYAAVSLIVAGLAGVAAAFIDTLALLIAVRLRERLVLSGLTSTLAIMVFYIVIFLGAGSAGWVWYERMVNVFGEFGLEIWPAILAGTATFLVWLILSMVRNRGGPRPTFGEMLLAFVVVCASGVVLIVVALLPDEMFSFIARTGGGEVQPVT